MKMLKHSIVAMSALIIAGCGGGSTSTTDTTAKGRLIDSFVVNVDCQCGDGAVVHTDSNGNFECKRAPVTFKIGNLELGTIKKIPSDGYVFPQDIVGVPRDDINNSKVIQMAVLLQSLDANHNPNDGIVIEKSVKEHFVNHKKIAQDIWQDLNITPIPEAQAQAHLMAVNEIIKESKTHKHPKEFVDSVLEKHNSKIDTNSKNFVIDVLTVESENINLYEKLISYYIETHEHKCVDLLKKLHAQELKNYEITLYIAKKYGIKPETNSYISQQYETYLEIAKTSKKNTLLTVAKIGVNVVEAIEQNHNLHQYKDIEILANFVKEQNYKTYWAVDDRLKDIGIEKGVCSDEEICHPDYPNN